MVLIEVALAIIVALFVFFKWSFRYWERRNVPCASKPRFPFGNLPVSGNIGIFLKELYLNAKEKGLHHTGLYSFTIPAYLPLNLDEIKHVLQGGFPQFPSNCLYNNQEGDLLSSNILFIAGDRWQYLRRKLSPVLTSSKRKLLLGTVVQAAQRLQQVAEETHARKKPMDVHQMANAYSVDVVASMTLSLTTDVYHNPQSEFAQFAKDSYHFKSKFRRIMVAFGVTFPRIARWFNVVVFDKQMNEFLLRTVRESVAFRQANQIVGRDMLQLLLDEEGNPTNPTDEVIRELTCQIFTIFNAGFETTSMALTYCLYELAMNSPIQDRLRSEIKTVLAQHQGDMSWNALTSMTYLEQVIKETLRKYPPIPGLSRRCKATHTIPNTTTVIEKDTIVTIATWGLHYDPEYYPEPDKFDPERFCKGAQQIPFTYLPFGEGPRMCPGFTFGFILIKVALIKLLQQHRFTLNAQTKLPIRLGSFELSLEPQSPIFLDIEEC